MWALRIKRGLRALGRKLATLALVDLAIAAIAGLVCWFAGWRTLESFGLSLLGSGAIVFVIAGMSALGSTKFIASPGYMLARSVEAKPLMQRMSEDIDHVRDGFDFLFAASGVSISLLFLGGAVLGLAR